MFFDEDLDPEELKIQGNLKWKQGDIEEANTLWRQSLKECIKYSMRGLPTTKNRDMQISLRLNLSLYHFKKQEYSECINQCNIILENIINLDEILSVYITQNEQNKNTTTTTITNIQTQTQTQTQIETETETEKTVTSCEEEMSKKSIQLNTSNDVNDNVNDNINENHDKTLKNEKEEETKEKEEATKEKEETKEENKYIKKETLLKVFIRMAHAFLCLQDFDKCKENIDTIRKLDSKNGEIIILLQKMQNEERDFKQKQKELYKRMYLCKQKDREENRKENGKEQIEMEEKVNGVDIKEKEEQIQNNIEEESVKK